MAGPTKAVKAFANMFKQAAEEAEAARELATAADRAAAGRKAADVAKATDPMRMSEALGSMNIEGKGKVNVTQSDRTRVGGGNIGGAMFPGLQHVDPNYAGFVWGVGGKPTASNLIRQSDENTLWTTLLGAEDQLKSNPLVFDRLFNTFKKEAKAGNLDDELRAKINAGLEPMFGKGADILDPKLRGKIDTFPKRAAVADLLLGKGIGGEQRGGSIIPGTKILTQETEPLLLHPKHGGDVPTFAVGPRLFNLSGEMAYRPDVHPGFPMLLKGEDKGVVFRPAPGEIAMRDYAKRFKAEKGRSPGYYDWTMGTKGEGLPSQLITEEYLTYLQKAGFKKGGSVKDQQKQLDEMMAPLFAKGGKVEKSPQQQLDEMLAPLMGKSEEIKPLQWKADGGAMKVREPAIKRMKWKDTAPMKMAQGGVPSLGPASEHMMPDPTDSGTSRFEPGYADGGAAFGVFPQMKGKRSKQDREAAKNVPIDVARGIVSGVLGAPGDIESLVRMLPGLSEKTVLPTSEDVEKRLPFRSESPVSQAASGLGQLAGGFYTGPGSPMRLIGGLPSAVKRASQDFVMAAPEGAPRMFIGPKAKTWDQAKADAAVRMEKDGLDPIDIWRETGTFRGADGILRQEISDQSAKFLTPEDRALRIAENKLKIDKLKSQIAPTAQKDLFPKALTEAKKEAREDISLLKGENKMRERNPRTQGLNAEYIFEHPELYAAYPELRNINVVTEGGSGSSKGSLTILPSSGHRPGLMEMDIYDSALRSDPSSTTLHEMQHAVQTLEGMSPGGNPTMAFNDPKAFEILKRKREEIARPMTIDEFKRGVYGKDDQPTPERLSKAYEDYLATYKISPQIDRIVQQEAAMEYYKRLAGEAEARATQARQMMSPSERRKEFPYASYDVLPEEVIVKPPREFQAGGKASMAGAGSRNGLDAHKAKLMSEIMAKMNGRKRTQEVTYGY